MNYAEISNVEICNGEGIGVSLFVQGCKFHCKNCFNQETWDFNGGKEWTKNIEEQFLQLTDRPYIKRVSILGGEPLEFPNEVFLLVNKVKERRNNLKIWIYSGYAYEEIISSREKTKAIIGADILVDGRYVNKLKDITLPFRGSSNQRIIDVQKSLREGEVILHDIKI